MRELGHVGMKLLTVDVNVDVDVKARAAKENIYRHIDSQKINTDFVCVHSYTY